MNKIKSLNQFLLTISIMALFGSYYVEYFMHLPPCPLCLYQRYAYFILILFSGLGLFALKHNLKQKVLQVIYILSLLSVITAIGISGYHSGVERGLFKAGNACSPGVKIPDDTSIEDVKELLYNKSVATCSRPALVVFTLSMTEWNLLLNIFLLGYMLLVVKRK